MTKRHDTKEKRNMFLKFARLAGRFEIKNLKFLFALREQKGFSFIEALVAISILITSIAGPMTIAQQGLSAARISVDQITAFYLAQEAVEGIRHIRDTNVLNGDSWLTGLSLCIDTSCTLDITQSNEIEACESLGVCDPIRYHEQTNLYGYDGRWSDSKFTRDIRITQIVPNEIAIEVFVTWNAGVLSRSVVIQESLFNWQ